MGLCAASTWIFFAVGEARATEYASSNFRVLDPVFQAATSTQMSSNSFRLYGSVGQIAIGTSSASTFKLSSGFLTFPVVTLPVVSATAGAGQVSLSWTAATGALGWTVSGYNVGQATASGGPYTYSASLGNVTSSTRTGLSNGTAYYFVVRAEDALGNSIATSSEVSITPAASAAASETTATNIGGGIIASVSNILSTYRPGPLLEKLCSGCLEEHGFLQRLSTVLSSIMGEAGARSADLNADGRVDLRDVSILFARSALRRIPSYVEEKTGGQIMVLGSREARIPGLTRLKNAEAAVSQSFSGGTYTWNRVIQSIKDTGKKVIAFLISITAPLLLR